MYPRWSTTPWACGCCSNWPQSLPLGGHQNVPMTVERGWFALEATSGEFDGYFNEAYFEGQYDGEQVAGCVNGSDAACVGEIYHQALSCTREADKLGAQNGWFQASFQTDGDCMERELTLEKSRLATMLTQEDAQAKLLVLLRLT